MHETPSGTAVHCALVTGAAGGIGYEFCREFARRGMTVIMVDLPGQRIENACATLTAEFPAVDIHAFGADLTAPDICNALDMFLNGKELEPDILVNNAGIFSFNTVAGTPEDKINCFIDLHVRAVTMLSRWFAKRRIPLGSGRLLNMSSMSCWMPMPGIAMYSSTKAYIRVFSRALHYELKETGCMVTVACPGGIATDLFGLSPSLKRLAVRIGAIEAPEKFTRKAIDKMLKGRKQYINGMANRLAIIAVAMTPTPLRMAIKHLLLDKGIKV